METKSILIACSLLDYVLIEKTLQGKYILEKAEKGEDILRLRKQHRYDLLLLDVAFMKPDFKVISGVVEENIPVIALSSEPYDSRNQKIIQAGCCACYVKPIRQELFAAFIEYWLNAYSKN